MVDIEELASKLNALFANYGITRDQMADLLGGAADGGPNADGRYLVTLANGTTRLAPSPARLAFLSGNVAEASAVLQPLVSAATTASQAAQPLIVDLALPASKVATVSADLLLGAMSKIGTVAASMVNVNAVGGDLLSANKIGIVAAGMANIGLVAGSIAGVNTVAASIANVNAVFGAIANIGTVAGSIINVNVVGTNIAAVSSAAANIPGIIAAPAAAASAAASATTVALTINSARPRYLAGRQLASGVAGAGWKAVNGAYLDGSFFIWAPAIGVSNGLKTVGGALQLGDVEGIVPLGGAATTNVRRPRYLFGKQAMAGLTDSGWKALSATFLDGAQYASAASVAARTDAILVIGDSLANPLAPLISTATGRQTVNLAVGGQTPTQTATRLLGTTVRIANAQIVAGSNNVTHLGGATIASQAVNAGPLFLSTAATTAALSARVTLGSIIGTMTRTVVSGAETYSFTPDAGQTLPVTLPNDSAIVPDTAAYQHLTIVISAGRNSGFTDGTTLAAIQRIARLFPHGRMIVLATPNRDASTEWAGTALYGQIVALNAGVAAEVGYRLLDWPRLLKDRGLALAGLSANAQDATDKTNDVVSNQLRADDTHLNTIGYGLVVSAGIVPILQARNW